MKSLLVLIFLFSPQLFAQTADTLEQYPGLHVLGGELGPDYEYRFISKEISENIIEQLLNDLDWIDGFHQVILVSEPSVSIEVGGSMSPEHGLSGVFRDYRNEENKIHLVTEFPPTNIGQMKQILVLFSVKNENWKSLYGFK